MRPDILIALLLGVAALAAALAAVAAPELFHDLSQFWLQAIFYGGLTVAVGCLIAAVAVAFRHREAGTRRSRSMIPLAGMILTGFSFLFFTAWFFWFQNNQIEAASTPTTKPSEAEEIATTRSLLQQAARIVVSKYDLVPVKPDDPNSDLAVRVFLINRGSAPGYAPMMTALTRVTDGPLPSSDINDGMKRTLKSATAPPGREQQVEVGQEYWLRIEGLTVSSDHWKAVKAGTKRIYIWIVLAFVDDSLQDGSRWLSEYCGTQSGDISSINICGQRTYLQPAT